MSEDWEKDYTVFVEGRVSQTVTEGALDFSGRE